MTIEELKSRKVRAVDVIDDLRAGLEEFCKERGIQKLIIGNDRDVKSASATEIIRGAILVINANKPEPSEPKPGYEK